MLARPDGRDHPRPWNKGLLVGQKKPLQPKHVWSIRVRLEIARMWRDLALFNLAIDSKLRACDLVKLRVDEVCLGARQYSRLVHRWVNSIGLESISYDTHSMRRTKATQIYRKTGNLRAVQLLLGHTKLESTVRYLGIEVDDALQIAEQIEL
jgi:site-specific recombinase XerC